MTKIQISAEDQAAEQQAMINSYEAEIRRLERQLDDEDLALRRNADHIDGYDLDDLGESPDY
jgi:hypothetical protein